MEEWIRQYRLRLQRGETLPKLVLVAQDNGRYRPLTEYDGAIIEARSRSGLGTGESLILVKPTPEKLVEIARKFEELYGSPDFWWRQATDGQNRTSVDL
jgi:hypothetical protein